MEGEVHQPKAPQSRWLYQHSVKYSPNILCFRHLLARQKTTCSRNTTHQALSFQLILFNLLVTINTKILILSSLAPVLLSLWGSVSTIIRAPLSNWNICREIARIFLNSLSALFVNIRCQIVLGSRLSCYDNINNIWQTEKPTKLKHF